jgi:hypothetical protein
MTKDNRKMIVLNPKMISVAVWVSENDANDTFSDGRVASRFTEKWASRIYNLIMSKNTNNPGSDADIQTGNILLGNIPVGVRSLSKAGIKFQQSKFIGSGRTCTIDNLIESIKAVEIEIVVDIADAPKIKFIPIYSKILLKMISDGVLTPNGLTRNKFYTVLFGRQLDDDDFDIVPIYEQDVEKNMGLEKDNL